MIRILLVLALAATGAMAQSQNPTAPAKRSAPSTGQSAGGSPSAKKPSSAGQNAADSSEAVITIQGLCSPPAAKSAGVAATPGCKTVVTKAQFEGLLNTINPSHQPISQAQRQQLAQRYVELLTYAEAARKAGMENKPQFQALLRIQRLQTLQQVFLQDLEERYKNPSQQEIQKFYSDNQPKFEEVKLHRIFIPKSNPSGQGNKEEYEKKAPMVANDIRERAAKGEDPDKLQKEAYATLDITSPSATTDLGKRKRGMFPPPEEQDIFALKAGEVTKVESGASGLVIYKVDSKETIPLEQVKDEISHNLSQQQIKARVDSLRSSVHPDFNKEYFAPPLAPAAPPSTAVPPTPKPGTAPGYSPIPSTPATSPKPATPGTASTPPSPSTSPSAPPSAPPK